LPTIIVTLIGLMATVFAVSSSIPQIIKSIKSKKTDDASSKDPYAALETYEERERESMEEQRYKIINLYI